MSEHGKLGGREVKIGLTVIALLVIVLGVVLFRRLGGQEIPTAQMRAGALPPAGSEQPSGLDPSGRPTVLHTQPSYETATAFAATSQSEPHHSGAQPLDEAVDPTTQLMPRQSTSPRIDNPYRSGGNRYDTAAERQPPDELPNGAESSANFGRHLPSSTTDNPAVEDRYGQPQTTTDSSSETPAPSLDVNDLLPSVDSGASADSPQGPATSAQLHQTFRDPSLDAAIAEPVATAEGSVADATAAAVPAAAAHAPEEFPPAGALTQTQAIQTRPYSQQTAPETTAYGQQSPYTQQTAPQDTSPTDYSADSQPTSVASDGKYYVEPGDSMWTISRKVYGTGGFFKALQEHNRRRYENPHELDVGDELWTPDVAVLREKYPYLCPKERKRQPGTARIATVSVPYNSGGRTYKVETGDTLYDIARYELGSGGRWPEIYMLNRDRLGEDIDYLKPGTPLVLPTAEGQGSPGQADAITQRPTGVLPR